MTTMNDDERQQLIDSIDPTELDYDMKTKTSTKHDNTRHVLGRIEDTETWIMYTSWQVGPSEYQQSIKGIGHISFNGKSLDTDSLAEKIRHNAQSDIREDESEWTDTDVKLNALVENADEVATELALQWEYGCEEVCGNHAYDGTVTVENTTVSVGHVEEAYYYETEHALHNCGIEEDGEGRVLDQTRQSLSSQVSEQYRNRYRHPHAEYVADLEFTVDDDELRAIAERQ